MFEVPPIDICPELHSCEPGRWLILALAATGAAWIGSVAGTGGTTVLLPVLVVVLGVKDALPVLTLCNVTANASRAWINRREINGRLVGWFLLFGVPSALAGAYLFTQSTPELLVKLMGGFLVGVVVWRRLAARRQWRQIRIRRVSSFGPLGAGFGFLYGFTEGVGPLMAPFFLGFGLLRGAYIGTDAMGTMFLQGTKLAAFGHLGVLPLHVLALGLALAPFMILGSWLGKHTLDRMPPEWFTRIIEIAVLASGLSFLLA